MTINSNSVRLVSTPASTMPRSMYNLYKAQAEELNRVTGRIKRITEAIQVKGEVLQRLLETLANPPKMVIKKTGPSTFERVTEGKA